MTDYERYHPPLLIALVFLSGINILIEFFGTIISIVQGPFSTENFDKKITEAYNLIEQLRFEGYNKNITKMLEISIENTEYINNNAFHLNNYLTLFTLVLGSVSIFLMLRLKKIGFRIYVAYCLLPINFMYILSPTEYISHLYIVLYLLVTAILCILYSLNLKYME